jgi:hypothetical protein
MNAFSMKLKFFWFAAIVLLLSGCKQNPTITFQGKWQSLNDKDVVIIKLLTLIALIVL